jgi:hypothetical protein
LIVQSDDGIRRTRPAFALFLALIGFSGKPAMARRLNPRFAAVRLGLKVLPGFSPGSCRTMMQRTTARSNSN